VAGSSILSMIDARQAPAQIKGSNLRILTWSHFIPAYDTWFDKMAKEWGDKNGVKVRVDHIPLETRPGWRRFCGGWPRHFVQRVDDPDPDTTRRPRLTDTTTRSARSTVIRAVGRVDGRIYAMPLYYILLPMICARTCSTRWSQTARHLGTGAGALAR
jgi:hypothetical protein